MITINDTLINAMNAQTDLIKEVEELYGRLEQHKEAAILCRLMIESMQDSGEYDQTALIVAKATQRAIANKINAVYAQLEAAKDRATLYRAVIKSYQ